jgi:hypothetical protein
LDGAALRDETLDGVGHVGDPGLAAELTIGKDLEPDLFLAVQCIADGDVFLLGQGGLRELAAGLRLARTEESGGPEQAADVVGAERPWRHAISVSADGPEGRRTVPTAAARLLFECRKTREMKAAPACRRSAEVCRPPLRGSCSSVERKKNEEV